MHDFFAFFGQLIESIMKRLYPMPSTDNLSIVPEPAVVPASPVIIAPKAQNSPVEPVSAPTPPVLPPSGKTPNNALITFCTAIRDFEGAPGNLNYKNNNPGNVRCSPVGYLPMYGNVKCVNNFSVFPTYELGWLYLQNLVHFRIHAHPDWTFLDFFNNYAPTADKNEPNIYAANVAKKCGVPVDSKISAFLG